MLQCGHEQAAPNPAGPPLRPPGRRCAAAHARSVVATLAAGGALVGAGRPSAIVAHAVVRAATRLAPPVASHTRGMTGPSVLRLGACLRGAPGIRRGARCGQTRGHPSWALIMRGARVSRRAWRRHGRWRASASYRAPSRAECGDGRARPGVVWGTTRPRRYSAHAQLNRTSTRCSWMASQGRHHRGTGQARHAPLQVSGSGIAGGSVPLGATRGARRRARAWGPRRKRMWRSDCGEG
jgi:hypothetical protein